MKKSILLLFFTFLVSTFCFAISDITLYMENEPFAIIKDNKIYDPDDELIGEILNENIKLVDTDDKTVYKIQEDENYLSIFNYDFTSPIITASTLKFSKKNGFLIMEQDATNGKHANTKLYYEDTGLLQKETYYNNSGEFSYSTEYFYDDNQRTIKEIEYDENKKQESASEYFYYGDTEKKIKQIEYDSNNELDYYIIFTYDKKYEILIFRNIYDKNDKLTDKYEYDPITEKLHYCYEYDDENKIKTKTTYDLNTGYRIEKLIYNGKSKDPEKWTFLDFKDTYELEDGYYLSHDFCHYWGLSSYTEKDLENWNDFYSAKMRKVKFDYYCDGWKQLQKLIDDKYLFYSSFTLCKRNSNTYYCFTYTKDDFIDYSNVYEITLTRKEVDYAAMNKSGKGTGPFGFDIAMSYDDVKVACNGEEPELIADDRYYVKPKKTHPLFQKYILWISPKYGVYYIKAHSSEISTSEYGTEVKNKFENLVTILEKKYGTFKRIDTVKPDYSWKDDKDWMQALKDGARKYQAVWTPTAGTIGQYDGLNAIYIGIDAVNGYSTKQAYIWIEYSFRNYDDADDLLNDVL